MLEQKLLNKIFLLKKFFQKVRENIEDTLQALKRNGHKICFFNENFGKDE